MFRAGDFEVDVLSGRKRRSFPVHSHSGLVNSLKPFPIRTHIIVIVPVGREEAEDMSDVV